MTPKSELIALAERCEAASGADRELDCRIWAAIGKAGVPFDMAVAVVPDFSQWIAPSYTASLDAAMTLVPEGLGVSMARHGKRSDDCSAYVGKSDSDARGNFMTDTFHAEAKTMALALCAAALKARAGRLTPQEQKQQRKASRARSEAL